MTHEATSSPYEPVHIKGIAPLEPGIIYAEPQTAAAADAANSFHDERPLIDSTEAGGLRVESQRPKEGMQEGEANSEIQAVEKVLPVVNVVLSRVIESGNVTNNKGLPPGANEIDDDPTVPMPRVKNPSITLTTPPDVALHGGLVQEGTSHTRAGGEVDAVTSLPVDAAEGLSGVSDTLEHAKERQKYEEYLELLREDLVVWGSLPLQERKQKVEAMTSLSRDLPEGLRRTYEAVAIGISDDPNLIDQIYANRVRGQFIRSCESIESPQKRRQVISQIDGYISEYRNRVGRVQPNAASASQIAHIKVGFYGAINKFAASSHLPGMAESTLAAISAGLLAGLDGGMEEFERTKSLILSQFIQDS